MIYIVNTQYYLLLIILSCLVILFIYFRVKRFTSLLGIMMFILGFLVLFLRIYLQNSYPLIGFLRENTLNNSFLLISAPTLVFLFFAYNSKGFKQRFDKLKKLLLPYIFFGALQQIFFSWVFSDSLYYLTNNLFITFIGSFSFFMAIHLNWESSIKKYWFLLAVFALIGNWIYLIWNNILPQILLHGIVGAVLFTNFTNTDQLKLRLG